MAALSWFPSESQEFSARFSYPAWIELQSLPSLVTSEIAIHITVHSQSLNLFSARPGGVLPY